MYKLSVDGIEVQNADIKVIEPYLEEALGCAGTLTYSVPYDAAYYDGYREKVSTIAIYEGENTTPMWRGRLLSSRVLFNGSKELMWEGELAYLNDIQFPPFSFQGDIPELVQRVLTHYNSRCHESRRFTLGTVNVTDPNHYITRSSEDYMSCWSVLSEKLADMLGGFFRIRYADDGTRILDYISDSGVHNTQRIEFGVNLLDLEDYINAEEIATVLIPLGAELEDGERVTIETAVANESGLPYIESPFVSNYGRIEVVAEWEDVTLPDNLYRKALEYSQKMALSNVEITVKVVDLHLTSDEIEALNVGDKVVCLSRPHGIEVEMTISERSRNLNNPADDELTIGTVTETFSESMNETFREMQDEAEKQKVYNSDLAHRIETAKGLYTTREEQDGVTTLWMHDKPLRGDSQLILNVSNQGIHVSGDYGATWAGLDFDGEFIARLIDTYYIKADRIQGGTLASLAVDDNGQPVTYINMDAGDIAKLGNIAWVKRSTGNESLKWMGESN